MSLKSVTIDEKNKTITIVLDLETPRASASGKSLVVGSTRGGVTSETQIDGKAVTVNVNAYIRP